MVAAGRPGGELQRGAVRGGYDLHIHAVLAVLLRLGRLVHTDPVNGH